LQCDSDNQPTRMVGTAQDITERSLQDEALRKSEAFLEQTGRLRRLGYRYCDEHRPIIRASPEAGAEPGKTCRAYAESHVATQRCRTA
jgi:hypothetical protein